MLERNLKNLSLLELIMVAQFSSDMKVSYSFDRKYKKEDNKYSEKGNIMKI